MYLLLVSTDKGCVYLYIYMACSCTQHTFISTVLVVLACMKTPPRHTNVMGEHLHERWKRTSNVSQYKISTATEDRVDVIVSTDGLNEPPPRVTSIDEERHKTGLLSKPLRKIVDCTLEEE
jgi:hypothetical protein